MPPTATESETPLGRVIREQGRLKQWVAEQLGVGRDRVTRLVSGEVSMTVDEAVRLGEILSVDPTTFLPAPESD